MVNMILRYLILLGAFLAIDMVWLGFVAKNFYRQQLGFLMKKNVNWVAAILFYLLFILGLLVFVVNRAVADNSIWAAVLYGALFGLVTYSTYDLTNLSTIRDWPLKITVVDLVWGTTLSSLTSLAGFLIIGALSL
ncbi:MAG: DUF2177 family protein [Clostridia bacterium]